MAKKGMNLQYKKAKRERKNNNVKEETNESLGVVKTVVGVLVFLLVCYLLVLGMEKLGLFEQGYTAPVKGETEIDYEYIPVGTVFNRTEKEYFVLFDNYDGKNQDVYVNYILDSDDKKVVYKVDMSLKENEKYKSEQSNPKAKNPTELKINDITLIKIKNGKIEKYVTGSEKIEEYLK